jgi:hypothetical protein
MRAAFAAGTRAILPPETARSRRRYPRDFDAGTRAILRRNPRDLAAGTRAISPPECERHSPPECERHSPPECERHSPPECERHSPPEPARFRRRKPRDLAAGTRAISPPECERFCRRNVRVVSAGMRAVFAAGMRAASTPECAVPARNRRGRAPGACCRAQAGRSLRRRSGYFGLARGRLQADPRGLRRPQKIARPRSVAPE